jgi:hypothetical protein
VSKDILRVVLLLESHKTGEAGAVDGSQVLIAMGKVDVPRRAGQSLIHTFKSR